MAAKAGEDIEGAPGAFPVAMDPGARAEHRVAQLSRVYAVVTAVRQVIVRTASERDLFERACRIAVDQGRFRFAWVGAVDRERARVVPVARAGHEAGYLDAIRVDIGDTPYARGPSSTALREDHPVVANDLEHDPRMAPWRDAARARGYRSSAAFPIRRAGEVVAVLGIYAGEPNIFDAEEVRLFRDMTDDIGFALDALDADERRRDAERRLAGTGLGLAICHSLMSAQGGGIGAESRVGRGTTMRIWLPVADSPAAVEPAATATVTGGGRVLVVDDEPMIGRTIQRALAGHDVTVTERARDALRLCGEQPFDCIVSDLMMPGMSGMDLYEALAREHAGLERRVVFVTGGAVTERAREFLANVSNPCLEKPFALSELAEVVARAIAAVGRMPRS